MIDEQMRQRERERIEQRRRKLLASMRSQSEEEFARKISDPNADAFERQLLEAERKWGPPKRAGREGNIYEFTTPEGYVESFDRDRGNFAFTLPTARSNDYSPQDQRQIERLYRQRSTIATDPDLDRDEDARQRALDEIDTALSRIPVLSPMMRQPTPQETFEQAVVTGPDGTQYLWDGKTAKPLEKPKAEQDAQNTWMKDFHSEYDRLNRVEDSGDTPTIMTEKARAYADLMAAQRGLAPGAAPATPPGEIIPQPDQFGIPRGGGTVTVGGTTATITPSPKGLETIWPDLDEELRLAATEEIRASKDAAKTAKDILSQYKKILGK
jgi:hypothetical protein